MRLDVLRDDIYYDDNIVSTKTNADAAEKQKKGGSRVTECGRIIEIFIHPNKIITMIHKSEL